MDVIKTDTRAQNPAEAVRRSLWNFLKRSNDGTLVTAPLTREGAQPLQASADQIQASKAKTTVVAK